MKTKIINFQDIVLAKIADIPGLLELFVKCTDHMLAAGIDQWHYDYPNEQVISKDISTQTAFLIKDKKGPLGTITLNEQQDDQYKKIEWEYSWDKILVIHRLAVHPRAQGLGIGKKLCLFADQFAKTNNYTAIRLDAYAGNPASNHIYLKLGYRKAKGTCEFHNNPLPFYCYEKKISLD